MPKTRRVLVPIMDEDGVTLGEKGVEISEQCLRCKHKGPNLSCTAYEVIPEEILGGGHDHRLPFPGDNGIRFQPNPRVKQPPRGNPPSRDRVRALRNERKRIRAQIAVRLLRRP